jgi:hypothetical protein
MHGRSLLSACQWVSILARSAAILAAFLVLAGGIHAVAQQVDSAPAKTPPAAPQTPPAPIGPIPEVRRSPVWFVSNAEAAKLARGCASAECAPTGDPRNPDVPLTEDQQ